MTTPARTVDDIDRDLANTHRHLERALSHMSANAAEIAMIAIDQLLDERLQLRASR